MNTPESPRPPAAKEKPLFLLVLSSDYLTMEADRMMRMGKTKPEEIRDALMEEGWR